MVPRNGAGCRNRVAAGLPAWLTDADIDFYAGEFKRTGFRGRSTIIATSTAIGS